MHPTIRNRLLELAEPSYRDFSAALVPGANHMLGVRLPALRKLAQTIYRDEDWRAFLRETPAYFEETMLQGMVIGQAVRSWSDFCDLVPPFLPQIQNWSVCDSFCCSLRATAKFRDALLPLLLNYTRSDAEFVVRFGVVMLMDYYVTENDIDLLLNTFAAVRHNGYYAKMAVAWALSVCFVKFPQRTMAFLQTVPLDSDTYRKTLQKILESRRVGAEEKAQIRAMKQKI